MNMRPRTILSLGNFFSYAHFYLIVYILTPYLATIMPADTSGLVVSLGAIITLAVFPFMPQLLKKHDPQRLSIAFAAVEFVVLLLLAASPGPALAIILIAIACAGSPLIAYQLDLLLEASVSDEATTGRVRTLFLTAGNAALLLTPLVIGFLLIDGDRYQRVFLVAALTLLPFMLLMLSKNLPRIAVPRVNLRDVCLCIAADADMRAIAIANGVLQFFFHLAPLYVPLYLHNVLLIPWSQLGWMFALMLVPYVLIEYPAGWLADTRLGDRLLLAVGFVITGLSIASFALVGLGTPLWLLIGLLMLTRIGAALVEAMVEGHFFRRVRADDAGTVSVFRMMRPGGALVAPIVGTILLSGFGFDGLFAVTGFIVLTVGFFATLSIRGRSQPSSIGSPGVSTGQL